MLRSLRSASSGCGFFSGGITNGADWYPITGGMQDFNYIFANTMEITVEVSCCKYPSRSALQGEWDKNKESLLRYVMQAHRGIKGTVTKNGVAVGGVTIEVRKDGESSWRSTVVTTDDNGSYWRLLMPGTYRVRAREYDGSGNIVAASNVIQGVVVADVEQATILDLTLL